jgi:uncharacterized membrane protein
MTMGDKMTKPKIKKKLTFLALVALLATPMVITLVTANSTQAEAFFSFCKWCPF